LKGDVTRYISNPTLRETSHKFKSITVECVPLVSNTSLLIPVILFIYNFCTDSFAFNKTKYKLQGQEYRI